MADDIGGGGHGQAPIIVVKKKVAGHGHHGGAWKVAYADMVTALMALFIVLWILSQSDEVIQSVAGYFSDPVGFKKGGLPSLQQGAGSGNQMAILEDLPKTRGSDNEGDLFRNQAKNLHDTLAKIPGLEKYKKQIETSVTPEGLRISLLESKNTPLFQLGGVALHSDAIPVLETIGQEIRRSGKSIVIEGHTDSKKYSAGSERTNWELSTGRAQTARRIFEKVGVPEDRILEIRGFADRKLYNPLDPLDSRNRRISITLLSDEMMAKHKELPSAKLVPWLAK